MLVTALSLATTATAQSAAKPKPKAPPSDTDSPVGIQGSLGFGGGDKLGLAGLATLGPRIGTSLISIRGTVGTGATIGDSIATKRYPIYEIGLTYGRRFCTPGACYSFAFGPGYVSEVILNATTGVHERENRGALLYQFSLQGTVTPKTTLGITLYGNRNSAGSFWGLAAGVQFGMPRQRTTDSDDE